MNITSKKLLSITLGILILGILCMLIGILLPLIVRSHMKKKAITSSYLSRENLNEWGIVPGKNELEVSKAFTMFGLKNENVGFGEIEMEEWGRDLEYEVRKNITKSEYIEQEWAVAPNYYEHYIPVNGSDLMEFQKLDTVNIGALSAWYQLVHKAEYKQIVPLMFKQINMLMGNLEYKMTALEAYNYYMKDKDMVMATILYDIDQAEDVYSDPKYGMGNLESLAFWIPPAHEHKASMSPNYGILLTHFGLTPEKLDGIYDKKSMFYGLLLMIRNRFKESFACQARDCKSAELVYLQLATQAVTLHPLIDLDNRPPYNSFKDIDSAFIYPPEISYFQELPDTGLTPTQMAYRFNMKNVTALFNLKDLSSRQSILNPINGLDFFHQMEEKSPVAKLVKVAYELKIMTLDPLYVLLGYMKNIIEKVGNYGELGGTRRESAFAELANRMLFKSISYLNNTLPLALYSRFLAAKIQIQNLKCQDLLATALKNVTKATQICSLSGFSPSILSGAEAWTKAFLNPEGPEYNAILTRFSIRPPDMHNLMAPDKVKGSIGNIILETMQDAATFYGCTNNPCDTMEMAFRQWGSSHFTRLIHPVYNQTGFLPYNNSLHGWVPTSQVEKPQEYYYWAWFYNKEIPPSELEILPPILEELLNKLLDLKYMKEFVIYADQDKEEMLKRIFKISQGLFLFSFFRHLVQFDAFGDVIIKRTAGELIWGYSDPFLLNYTKMAYSEGGDQGAIFNIRLTSENITVDHWEKYPLHHIHTGQNDDKLVREYAEYYGNVNISCYDPFFNGSGLTYQHRNPYLSQIKVKGTDGYQFKPGVNTDDDLYYFDPFAYRPLKLTYSDWETVSGLNTYKYSLDLHQFMEKDNSYNRNNDSTEGLWLLENIYQVPLIIGHPSFKYFPPKNTSELRINNTALGEYTGKEGMGNMDFQVEFYSGKTVEIDFSYIVGVAVQDNLPFPDLQEQIIPIIRSTSKMRMPSSRINHVFSQIKSREESEDVILILFTTLGALLIIIALVGFYFFYKKRKAENAHINASSGIVGVYSPPGGLDSEDEDQILS